jgi:hypothetical protein
MAKLQMGKTMAAQNIVKPSADSLAASAQAAAAKGPAPVHLWNPPYCGDIDMEIRRDGTWFYMGSPIGRPAMVRLFSSILKREGDAFFLVTPVEKVGIRVQDAPFVAVDVTVAGTGPDQRLTFTTHVGDAVAADADHPIRMDRAPATGGGAPYVMVRAGLEARIDRKTFYRLAEVGDVETRDGTDWFGLWSGGSFFPLVPAADLPAD